MIALDTFYRLFLRFRYPVSLPEEITNALGVPLNGNLSFEDFVNYLKNPEFKPTKLKKYMPRTQAELAFSSACHVDRFYQKSLFSYYFNQGWIEFVLEFDKNNQLRRVYLQHKCIASDLGLELSIS